MIEYIEIKGYKSIKEAKFELKPINMLVGANGSGKSNFISFFEFLNKLYDKKLKDSVASGSGIEKILHKGSKVTEQISSEIQFAGKTNGYSFAIKKGEESFVFLNEHLIYNGDKGWDISRSGAEANIKSSDNFRAKYVRQQLDSFKKYHFHETGKNSPFSSSSNVEQDIFFLYEKGENLAAFLFNIRQRDQLVYNRIVDTVQSIAPYFSDFYFQPNTENYLRLLWQDKYSSTIYGPSDFSDGTLRFIALATLFLQPNLPASIIIDEPELGLHPFAIAKLAGMIQSAASKGAQVIVATQSADLINYFFPENIITVDQKNGESFFKRLNGDELSEWIDEYSIGDLWQRNIIYSGQPA